MALSGFDMIFPSDCPTYPVDPMVRLNAWILLRAAQCHRDIEEDFLMAWERLVEPLDAEISARAAQLDGLAGLYALNAYRFLAARSTFPT